MRLFSQMAAGACALMLVGVAIPPAVSASGGTAGASSVAVSASGPIPTGMTAAAGISYDGRYLLGRLGGRWVVRDVIAGRTVRKLPSTWRYSYSGLSGSGKWVAYRRVSAFAGCQVPVPKVRNRITNASRWLATDNRGKLLKAKWRAARCPNDEDDSRVSATPQFSVPVLAADGRTAAFCANLERPDRYDLYLKRIASKRLTRIDGACSLWADGGDTGFQAPQISYDGSVVLAPGTDDESATWGPFQLFVGGTLRTGVVGRDPRLTISGATIFASRPSSSCQPASCPHDPMTYDVASGATIPLPPGASVDTAMSATGMIAITGDWPELAVVNRATSVTTSLTAQLQAAGLQQGYLRGLPMISGDGRWVLFAAQDQVYRLELAG